MPTKFDIICEPHKYGYEECKNCNGYGSSLKEQADICTQCGGDGVVKKAEEKTEA